MTTKKPAAPKRKSTAVEPKTSKAAAPTPASPIVEAHTDHGDEGAEDADLEPLLPDMEQGHHLALIPAEMLQPLVPEPLPHVQPAKKVGAKRARKDKGDDDAIPVYLVQAAKRSAQKYKARFQSISGLALLPVDADGEEVSVLLALDALGKAWVAWDGEEAGEHPVETIRDDIERAGGKLVLMLVGRAPDEDDVIDAKDVIVAKVVDWLVAVEEGDPEA